MTDLKLNEDGTFEIKFLKAVKVNNNIKVMVETPFGTNNITVKYNNYLHITGIEKWKYEVITLIKNKYKDNFKNTENVEEDLLETDENIQFNSNI